MRYDSLSNNALDDLYRSVAFVSTVILFFLFLASPAQANYIYDNATGSWKPTSRTVLAPPGAGSPFNYIPRDSPPTVTSTGGFQNKTGGSFGSPPVNGTSRTVPVTVNGTTTKPNVNRALLSRLGRGGLAGIALGAGIDLLLDGIGALIDDAGNVSRLNPDLPPSDFPTLPYTQLRNSYFCLIGQGDCSSTGISGVLIATHPDSNQFCHVTLGDSNFYGFKGNQCHYSTSAPPYVPTGSYDPVPLPELEDAINSGYNPDPSDYPFLAPDPAMAPTIVEVEPISRLNIPPTTTTTIDLDTGKTTTVETNIWHDFNIEDNNTNQPKIEVETTTKTDTYVDGDKTSETTITNNTGFANPEGAYDSDGNRLDIPPPVDCDLFPTACAWMEWTQEEPEEPDDDLSELLQEVPIVSETFTITGGSASCPAPLVLNLSQFGSREVSYQPLCDWPLQ